MTAKEFEKEMKQLYEVLNDDEEVCHIEMDNLMCKLLIELGYEKGVKIFQNTKKWYS